jgi:hypothetical protein
VRLSHVEAEGSGPPVAAAMKASAEFHCCPARFTRSLSGSSSSDRRHRPTCVAVATDALLAMPTATIILALCSRQQRAGKYHIFNGILCSPMVTVHNDSMLPSVVLELCIGVVNRTDLPRGSTIARLRDSSGSGPLTTPRWEMA